jgi:hypothetical protein
LNQMFGKARKRCQATPIVGRSPRVIAQVIEIAILIIATTMIAFSRVLVDSPVRVEPSSCPSG